MSADTALLARVAGNQKSIVERAALGRDMASRMAHFRVDQSIRDVFASGSPLFETARGISAAASIAQQIADNGPLQKTIRDLNTSIDLVAERQRLSFSKLAETIERATSGYANAYRIAESIGLQLSKQQEGVAAAISQMPTPQAIAMARIFEGLDVGEWDDIDQSEAADDAIHLRLIAVMLAVLSKLDPREWGPGEYLGILLFIVAWTNPDFSGNDRRVLAETRELSQLAAERADDAVEALKGIKQAEIARQHAIEYVSDLPRAEIIEKGNVREQPSGSSRQVAFLKQGTPIAVMEKSGNWLRIIYRDELTDVLAEGWLWRDSVTLLNPSDL